MGRGAERAGDGEAREGGGGGGPVESGVGEEKVGKRGFQGEKKEMGRNIL